MYTILYVIFLAGNSNPDNSCGGYRRRRLCSHLRHHPERHVLQRRSVVPDTSRTYSHCRRHWIRCHLGRSLEICAGKGRRECILIYRDFFFFRLYNILYGELTNVNDILAVHGTHACTDVAGRWSAGSIRQRDDQLGRRWTFGRRCCGFYQLLFLAEGRMGGGRRKYSFFLLSLIWVYESINLSTQFGDNR